VHCLWSVWAFLKEQSVFKGLGIGRVIAFVLTMVWKPTEEGLSFKEEKGDWRPRQNGMEHPSIVVLRQASEAPRRVLAQDTAGQVWLSNDFGEKWERLGQGAEHSAFGSEGFQVGEVRPTCEAKTPSTLWSWNYKNWDTGRISAKNAAFQQMHSYGV
jgi:hypothetical protein